MASVIIEELKQKIVHIVVLLTIVAYSMIEAGSGKANALLALVGILDAAVGARFGTGADLLPAFPALRKCHHCPFR